MDTVRDVLKVIGRKALADRLGVGLKAISQAAVNNCFPASWFQTVRDMCADCGQTCPESLFAFKTAPDDERPAA